MAKKRSFESAVLLSTTRDNAMAHCTLEDTWKVVDLLTEEMTDRQLESFLYRLRDAVQQGEIKGKKSN